MTPCAHTWIPLSVSLEECSSCGAQRRPADPYVHQQSGSIVRPTPPSHAERDKRRPLPPEILADVL